MANSGIKTVLTLRKYINGVATNETKPNLFGQDDYIAPYEDLIDCPIGAEPTTSTTTTTTTQPVETTTTTTQQQNFSDQYLDANCSSDTGGTYVDGGIPYDINATKTFTVPVSTNTAITLNASFTAGPSSVSCYARVYKSDSTLAYSLGQVSASTGTPVSSDTETTTLTAGTYTMMIYGADCGGGSTFGSFNLSVVEI